MSPSLELNGAEGISGAELCVFADWPLLRQAVILGWTLCLIILTGWDAGGQSHMLTYQTTTTAPGWEAKVKVNVRLIYFTVLCRVIVRNYCSIEKEKEEGGREGSCKRESCLSYVHSSKRRARLKWQLVICLSCPYWEERRRRIHRPLKSFIGSFCFLLSTNICVFLSFALLYFLLLVTTGVGRVTALWIVVFLHEYMLIQMRMQFSYSVF